MKLASAWIPVLPLLSALPLAACGSSSPAPAGPSVAVDDSCHGRLETLVTSDLASNVYTRSLAVGPDGSVYFIGGKDPDYATYVVDASGGAPRKISSANHADRMWVDGDALLQAFYGALSTLPLAGGDATLVAELPGTGSPDLRQDPPVFAGSAAAIDADFFYVGWMSSNSPKNGLSRVSRKDGHAEALFSSDDPAYQALFDASLAVDGDHLYVAADSDDAHGLRMLFRLPKSGGTPEILKTGWSTPGGDFLSPGSASVFGYAPLGPAATFERAPLGGSSPPVKFAGTERGVDRVALGASGAYVALRSGDTSSEEMAFARLPEGGERTTAIACTDAWPTSHTGIYVHDLAIGPQYLYALLTDSSASGSPTTIVRMRR